MKDAPQGCVVQVKAAPEVDAPECRLPGLVPWQVRVRAAHDLTLLVAADEGPVPKSRQVPLWPEIPYHVEENRGCKVIVAYKVEKG